MATQLYNIIAGPRNSSVSFVLKLTDRLLPLLCSVIYLFQCIFGTQWKIKSYYSNDSTNNLNFFFIFIFLLLYQCKIASFSLDLDPTIACLFNYAFSFVVVTAIILMADDIHCVYSLIINIILYTDKYIVLKNTWHCYPLYQTMIRITFCMGVKLNLYDRRTWNCHIFFMPTSWKK